jgi:glycosyltransferase involved in cell wall biosynthesis
MSDSLSFYMLIKNGEQYLEDILSRIAKIADEIILLDSGSQDSSQDIGQKWGAQWHFREFDNFRDQRTYALSLCRFKFVLFLDADEVPDESFIEHIRQLKQTGFDADAYRLRREWIVLGKPVHCIYPVQSPDFPVRLIDKSKVSFQNSNLVHEDYSGFTTTATLRGKVFHYTFHSREEMRKKLDFYTQLAAQNMYVKGKKFRLLNLLINPLAAWWKWYFLNGGWQDGATGITLANYAFRYTFLKYSKLRQLNT